MKEETGLLAWLSELERQGANNMPLAIGMNKYLESKARQRGVPFRGTFELTPQCNLDCKMCYVHLSDEQLRTSAKQVLTGTEWRNIMQQAVDGGMMYALLTGGEAMLHPDFDELFLFLCEQGVRVTVNTNGLLLTKERIAFFQRHMPGEIRVTLYGVDDDSYENVTGHRVFSRAFENICAAKEAGLPLFIGVTPSRYLEDKVVETVQLMSSLGLKCGVNTGLSVPREETGRADDDHDMSQDAYINLYKKTQACGVDECTDLCEEIVPEPGGHSSEEKHGFRCGGGRSSFAIVWHGRMQPCLTFTDYQVDLADHNFKEAWRKVNRFVSEYPVPRECFGCPYEGYCSVCVVRHAEGAPVGHADPAICEWAKRLIQEGLFKLKPRN